MSDRDSTPDPMDRAYAQAEAMLDDDAARAARRARVLAAVAGAAAEPQPAPRRSLWRHGGWLAAASVAGISVFVATQIDRPATFERPSVTPMEQAPAARPATRVGPPPLQAPPPAIQPPASAPEQPARARAAPVLEDRPAAVTAPAIPPLALPPAPPPPPAPSASVERRIGAVAPAPPRAQRPAPGGEVVVSAGRRFEAPADSSLAERAEEPRAARKAAVEELVVTGARAEPPGSPAAQATRLRDAATNGRTRELSVLLSRGVPIDAVDDAGETALMQAIQARQLDAVALLRRRGASLDLKNEAGRSARDIAAAMADPELNKALGLER